MIDSRSRICGLRYLASTSSPFVFVVRCFFCDTASFHACSCLRFGFGLDFFTTTFFFFFFRRRPLFLGIKRSIQGGSELNGLAHFVSFANFLNIFLDFDLSITARQFLESVSIDNGLDRLDDGFLDGELRNLGLCVGRNLALSNMSSDGW